MNAFSVLQAADKIRYQVIAQLHWLFAERALSVLMLFAGAGTELSLAGFGSMHQSVRFSNTTAEDC